MRKTEFKIIANLVTIFLLCITLVISVSYGWYTTNTKVQANGINASSASDSLTVSNQGAYRQNIEDEPYPEEEPDNDITGVLVGDEVYFSISLTSTTVGKKIIDIKVTLLIGGEFFTRDPIDITEEEYVSLGSAVEVSTYTSLENNVYTVYSEEDENDNASYYYIKLINQTYYKVTGSLTNGEFTPDEDGEVELGSTKPDISSADIVATYYSYETNIYKTYSGADGEYFLKANFDGFQQVYIYEGYEKYRIYQDKTTSEYFCITHKEGEYYKVIGTMTDNVFEPTSQTVIDITKLDLSNAMDTEIKYEDTSYLKRYNMIDVYTCDVYRIFGRRKEGNELDDRDPYYIIGENVTEKYGFVKNSATDKSRGMYPLYTYDLWTNDPENMVDENGNNNLNCCDEITFTFRFTFDYTEFITDHPEVNLGSLSNKAIEFNNILIYETEVKTDETPNN